MTNADLNEQVARKLGVEIVAEPFGRGPKDYSGSIEAAWEIVEKFSGYTTIQTMSGYTTKAWRCNMGWEDRSIDEYGDTAPEAICLAFLKVM